MSKKAILRDEQGNELLIGQNQIEGLETDLASLENNKANKNELPTKTSQLTNDSGFLTTAPKLYLHTYTFDNKESYEGYGEGYTYYKFSVLSTRSTAYTLQEILNKYKDTIVNGYYHDDNGISNDSSVSNDIHCTLYIKNNGLEIQYFWHDYNIAVTDEYGEIYMMTTSRYTIPSQNLILTNSTVIEI